MVHPSGSIAGYPDLVSNARASVDGPAGGMPAALILRQNAPNPFNPSTRVEFAFPKDGHVVVRVQHVLGREVATLYDDDARAGRLYSVVFEGARRSPGDCFCTIESGGERRVRKMVLLR